MLTVFKNSDSNIDVFRCEMFLHMCHPAQMAVGERNYVPSS